MKAKGGLEFWGVIKKVFLILYRNLYMSMNITMRIHKSKKVSILHLYSNNFYEPKIWSKIRQLYGRLICGFLQKLAILKQF